MRWKAWGMRNRPRWASRVLLGTAACALGGCTPLKEYVHNGFKVGPNYTTPPAAVAEHWIDASDKRVRSEQDDLSKWWTVFNDPTLDGLICDAYKQNLTLKEAGFRVMAARAQLGIAIGEIFPQQQYNNGSFTRNAVSGQVANRQFTPELYFNNWSYGFGLLWELDFWGKFRRAIESADDRLNASVFEFDDVLVTLLGDVAANYIQLRTLEQQLAYTRENVKLQKITYDIAQAQFVGGQVSELDPDQAQATLSQTESQIPQLEIQIRQAANRLCVLLGIPTEDLQKRIGTGAIPVAPPEIVVGVPADLLRRRPDIRRNERLAASAAADIGVADSAFYPAISILGNVGFSAEKFANLFTPQALYGSIGPSFQWNILNYGRIVNNVRFHEAKFLESVAHYQNSVLKANAEVEDGIIAFVKSHQQSRDIAESVKASVKSVDVALAQYKAGMIDFNRVSLLQQDLVTRQNLLAQANGSIGLGLVQTYKALGGGWQIRETGCEGSCLTLAPLAPAPAGESLPEPRPASPEAKPEMPKISPVVPESMPAKPPAKPITKELSSPPFLLPAAWRENAILISEPGTP